MTRGKQQAQPAEKAAESGAFATPAICVVGECELRLFGLTPSERLSRQLAALGKFRFLAVGELDNPQTSVVLVRADAVIDAPLLPVIIRQPNLILLSSDGKTPLAAHATVGSIDSAMEILTGNAGLPEKGSFLVQSPASLKADFWKSLRKRETPYALIVSPETLKQTAWRIFLGTYKGATDLVTKHVWPRPAFYATSWLAPRGISPNMVTWVSILLVFLAFYLFLKGHFLAGLLAAWGMTFLDTVDGKLARTTITSSKWGDILDHGVDLIHPPFWYIAWALGLASAGYAWSTTLFWWVIGAILGGYVLQRIMEGIAIKWLGLEIHIWRPVDTFFRQITARRNPNLLLLTIATVFGRPDIGLIGVAVWTVVCLILHGLQLAQALAAKRSGPLTSWMTHRP